MARGKKQVTNEENIVEIPGSSGSSKKSRQSQDDDESQQVTNTQAEKAAQKMNAAEFKRKVADMVRYLLFADSKKIGIKRADLVKNVVKEHSRAFAKIFDEASKQIKDTFGYEVVMMETDDGKSKGYILVNTLEQQDQQTDSLIAWGDDSPKMGLLMIILSMIFMNENAIMDGPLWHTLLKLGVSKDRQHEVFGDVEKLINQEFIKQNYLERNKVQGAEGLSFSYHIGTRSKKEISKRKLLEFVSEIYGIDSIKSWKMQYQEVVDSERQADVEMVEL